MLNRSRSWPVQSVATLDPRGIVRSKVQSPFDPKSKYVNGYNRDAFTIATPDLVLEANNANDRISFNVKPDIFFALELDRKVRCKKSKEKQSESMQVHFVDHYQVLDSGCFHTRPREFAVKVPTDENELSLLKYDQCNVPTEQVPLNRLKSIPKNEQGALNTDPNSTKTFNPKNKTWTACELCRYNNSYVKHFNPTIKFEEKDNLKFSNDSESLASIGEPKKVEDYADNGINQLLSSYQIDILRKNCLKSGKERRESSFDLNNSFDKDSVSKRKQFERKLTAEFESVASNETKTTDCDEKSAHKRSFKRDHKTNQAQLIRSYSLGHERTRHKLNGTFKKFSLPTPISQLKDGNDNAENAQEGSASLPRNVNLDTRKVTTLTRHYYPEGGWGYVIVTCSVMVHILCHGLQLSSGVLILPAAIKFKTDAVHAGWLGALSTAVALLLSPITIAFCRRKSTRVTAVVGGLITALGCLFTSFASQFHQLFFSYGTVIGVGVGLTRDCSTLMVAQYFKRRRELVEIFIVSGSGLGISVMSACIQGAINAIGWRLGLQAVTGAVFLTFILGTFYRSASLYHPQRRAILHLKNQKRKIKDKNKVEDRPAFLDTSTLRSKTVRILLASTGLSAFGINTPIFYLARQAEEEGLGERAVLLQAYLGLAWALGCAAFGLVVVHNSVECRIARQYLCQAAVLMCGLSILALTAVHGNYHGYVLFVWIYGIFCGGYHYSLKMYTYERVRARNFARTWGFVQCSQAIPIALGVPISGYMNEECGGKAGYYFSSTCTLAGSVAMFLIDVHRRRIARHKHTKANGQRHLCESESCPRRRPSIGAEPEPEPQIVELPAAELVQGAPGEKPELTCISEEGIADMDLPDNLLDDLDYIGITSCNKVENYLMLSEFENNLIAEAPVVLDKKGRRWSLARRSEDAAEDGGRWRLVPPKRTITVIDEASV